MMLRTLILEEVDFLKVLKCDDGEGWRRTFGPIVKKNEVLQRVKEERNITHRVKRQRSKWICHVLRINCPLKPVIA